MGSAADLGSAVPEGTLEKTEGHGTGKRKWSFWGESRPENEAKEDSSRLRTKPDLFLIVRVDRFRRKNVKTCLEIRFSNGIYEQR